jgi:DNA-binding MarR family transcriptional regulator
MNIEEARKMTIFKLMDLAKIVMNKANKMSSEEGFMVPFEQLPVIMITYYSGGSTQQYIADCLQRDKSSILRSINSLSGKGLMETSVDEMDKRKKKVVLTKLGMRIARRIASSISEVDEKIFSILSEDEKKQLKNLLEKCIVSSQDDIQHICK